MSTPAGQSYEPDRASAKIGAAGLLGLLALAMIGAAAALAMYLAFYAHTQRAPTTALERTPLAPQGPRLEARPQQDRLVLDAAARRQLSAYGWVDRQKGIAHIPIERAMALQAQAGWPDARALPPTTPPRTTPSPRMRPP